MPLDRRDFLVGLTGAISFSVALSAAKGVGAEAQKAPMVRSEAERTYTLSDGPVRDPKVLPTLFIQVLCDKFIQTETDPAETTGRVEVSIRGEFVGCALASFHTYRGAVILVPMSLGFSAQGRKEDVRVELHGELARLCRHTVIITETGK